MRRTSKMLSFALGLGMVVAGAGCNREMKQARNDQPATGSADRDMDRNAADRVSNPISSADRDFMHKAAVGGITEVQLGQIAQQKGRSEAVKDFGRKLVDDHTAANNKLKGIAADLNVSLPTDLDSEHQKVVDKYSRMAAGAKFDREFMKDAAEDHQKDIKEFETESGSGGNDRVKSFAADTLPTLREHLQMARNGQHK
jgi:putative membrane protein